MRIAGVRNREVQGDLLQHEIERNSDTIGSWNIGSWNS